MRVGAVGVGRIAAQSVADLPTSSSSPPVPPLVALHGFDSSLLEFRRFLPCLAAVGVAGHAVDLVGWGLSSYAAFDAPAEARPPLGPEQKRAHLYAFWKTVLKEKPMLLLGTSLGGAVALDFASAHPSAVAGLALVAPQAYTDGIGPLATVARAAPWAAAWGVRLLRTEALRGAANKMAYADVDTYATEDAMRIGRLHTHAAGWEGANVSFMASGGYSVSSLMPALETREPKLPTLIVWGRQDEILPPGDTAPRARSDAPSASFEWVDACGHCPHLEQPAVLADAVAAWARREVRGVGQ